MAEDLLGGTIGNIRIVDHLARGGTGEVYVGFDEQLNRKVALKAIRKRYRLDQEAKARLLREARILSRLDHPNICRIHDYVTAAERDFLILEFIPGKNLRVVLGDKLERAEAIRIALQLADVLQAAHGKGVIHRDLKPENVMLTPDGDVKVLDFGLARRLESDLTETLSGARLGDYEAHREPPTEDVRTRLGRVLGTMGYMSPEQARGQPVTSASDIYSLGLVLQEIFTGERPFLRSGTPREQLLRAAEAETLPVSGVDADLQALIERLKARQPSARPSASETAERLRWIRDKPRRRRRRQLTSAAVVFLFLTAVAMALLAVRISQEARRANREAEAARQVTDFVADLFAISEPGRQRGTTITAREILDFGAEKAERELGDQPLVRARIHNTIARFYQQLGLYEEALPLVSRALAVRLERLGDEHLDVAESQGDLAYLYWRQGDYARAEPLYERAIAIREKLLPADDPELAKSLNGLAILYWSRGDYARAEPLAERALDIRRRALGPAHRDVASSLDNLAILYKDQGRAAEAEPLYLRSLEMREQVLGRDHPEVATSLNNLGELYREQGRYAEAEPLYRRAVEIWEATLGADHPALAVGLTNLAGVYSAEGEFAAAEPVYRRALEIMGNALPADHPYAGYALQGLGNLYRATARPRQAEPLLERGARILEDALGEHRDAGYCLGDLAAVELDLGKVDESEAALRRSLAILDRAAPGDPKTLELIEGHAAGLRAAGETEKAAAWDAELGLRRAQ
jgi:eukaryotic-like serine/threonine-protein kinase